MLFDPKKALVEINDTISRLSIKETPSNLYDPIRYLMALGGKRMRPMLTLLGYALFKEDYQKAMLPAIGLEVFHNFTLMHDDIMDKAPLRRGKLTVHEKWNDSVAILSGDTMLVKAYELMLEVDASLLGETLQLFNKCAAEVCEGQQFDMDFEERDDVTEDEYLEMIRLKTAVLPAFCLQLGAMIAGASEKDADLLRQIGESMGVGFQLKDDLLDVYGDQAQFGKKVGGDILSNKKTFLMINARKQAEGVVKDELESWLLKNNAEEEVEKISAVTDIYNRLTIKEQTEQKMDSYFAKSFELLDQLEVAEEKKLPLKGVLQTLAHREN